MKTLYVNLTLIISGYPLTTPFTCDVNMLCVNSFISAVCGDIFQEQRMKVWWLQKRWTTNITTCVYRDDFVQPLKQAPWETERGVFGSACDVIFLNRCVETDYILVFELLCSNYNYTNAFLWWFWMLISNFPLKTVLNDHNVCELGAPN